MKAAAGITPVVKDLAVDIRMHLRKGRDTNLARVTYCHLPAEGDSAYLQVADKMDADLVAIVLHFESQQEYAVTWAMDERLEGIAVVDPQHPFLSITGERTDVSGGDLWGPLIGTKLSLDGVYWHEPGDAEVPCGLALRWSTHHGRSVVAALGTSHFGRPEYMPDELLVIHDEVLADEYLRPLSQFEATSH